MRTELDSTIEYYRERFPTAEYGDLDKPDQDDLLAAWVTDQPALEAFDALSIEESDRIMVHVADLVRDRRKSEEVFNARCAELGMAIYELLAKHTEDYVADKFGETLVEPDWRIEAERDYYRALGLR
jgi:hypothetical protein